MTIILTYLEEMQNESSQTATLSGSVATITTPASTTVQMVTAIPKVLITAMEVTVQTHQSDMNQATDAKVAQSIITQILECKNMSNKIKSLQIQLNVTWRSELQSNLRLDNVLARGGDGGVARLKASSRFLNVPVFVVKQPKEQKSWVLHPRKKLDT